MPQPFVAWKRIIDQLLLEKTQMKASFETEIRRIRRKYAPTARPYDIIMFHWCFFCASTKLTHQYNTRPNHSRIMEHLKQENRDLKEEIACLTAMMESELAAHSQSSPTPAILLLRGLPFSSPVMSVSPPVMHTLTRVEHTIYHPEPSEGPDVYEKMDEMKDQFLELRKELKTLRSKYLFGKSAAELCLVPNVKIPGKFKVTDFEKYKGNTCTLNCKTPILTESTALQASNPSSASKWIEIKHKQDQDQLNPYLH
ncbi:hypothetical protein KIW84_023560 [Lathyrus oleraceus]|uniref:Uncharacterized protein n=1 Tax=Pisum sativum TaxID=3888 RepID=A0A9D4YJ68_PEA|nr:hypothetical protein KIW84_023560 [Pisum sativum]